MLYNYLDQIQEIFHIIFDNDQILSIEFPNQYNHEKVYLLDTYQLLYPKTSEEMNEEKNIN